MLEFSELINIKCLLKSRCKKDDLLLIVRGLAALCVVFWHAGGYEGKNPAWMTFPGRTAVWIFFGISGYVIAYGFIHKRYKISVSDLKDYYWNRLLRIYPIFLALSALGWATNFLMTGSSPLALADVPSQIFALQLNQNYVLNGVFWTLGIELQFYLLAPVIFYCVFSDRLKNIWIMPAAFLYSGILLLIDHLTTKAGFSVDTRNILFCLPHFVADMVGCMATKSFKPDSFVAYVSMALAATILMLSNYQYRFAPTFYWSIKGVMLVDLALISLVLSHASWKGGDGILVSMFTTLGVLSYGIYAWHGYWLNTLPPMTQHVYLLLFISIICAYSTYRWIERPVLRFKKMHVANE